MKCHNYTYNSFIIDMTDIANFGTVPNTIAVFIDARSWEGWWYEGAGIYFSGRAGSRNPGRNHSFQWEGHCVRDIQGNRSDMVHVSIPVCETADSVPYILPVQNQILDGWKLYHKLFDEMPDANLQADVNDMNSFEPISFQGTPQPLFEGHPHSYGMYQVTFLLPAQQRKREISFPHVMGAAWVYLNGKLVHDSSRDMETRFVIPLPENLSGTQEMTVILPNKGENLSGCGIIEPVRLNVK